MYAYLLSRHGSGRHGYTYTDDGLDIAGVGNLMSSKYVKFRIIGLVWPLMEDSPYLCEVERYGRKHFLAVTF